MILVTWLPLVRSVVPHTSCEAAGSLVVPWWLAAEQLIIPALTMYTNGRSQTIKSNYTSNIGFRS